MVKLYAFLCIGDFKAESFPNFFELLRGDGSPIEVEKIRFPYRRRIGSANIIAAHDNPIDRTCAVHKGMLSFGISCAVLSMATNHSFSQSSRELASREFALRALASGNDESRTAGSKRPHKATLGFAIAVLTLLFFGSSAQVATADDAPNVFGGILREIIRSTKKHKRHEDIAPSEPTETQQGDDAVTSKTYSVGGMRLGNELSLDQSFKCRSSDQVPDSDWCSSLLRKYSPRGFFYEKTTVLRLADGTAAYLNRELQPAFFGPTEIADDIKDLTAKFGERPKLRVLRGEGSRPSATLAVWGDVVLTPLAADDAKPLLRGLSPHKGLLVDFLNDFSYSVRAGLPVFAVSGGPGYVWLAVDKGQGRGELRFFAADVSNFGESESPAASSEPSPKDQSSPYDSAAQALVQPPTPSDTSSKTTSGFTDPRSTSKASNSAASPSSNSTAAEVSPGSASPDADSENTEKERSDANRQSEAVEAEAQQTGLKATIASDKVVREQEQRHAAEEQAKVQSADQSAPSTPIEPLQNSGGPLAVGGAEQVQQAPNQTMNRSEEAVNATRGLPNSDRDMIGSISGHMPPAEETVGYVLGLLAFMSFSFVVIRPKLQLRKQKSLIAKSYRGTIEISAVCDPSPYIEKHKTLFANADAPEVSFVLLRIVHLSSENEYRWAGMIGEIDEVAYQLALSQYKSAVNQWEIARALHDQRDRERVDAELRAYSVSSSRPFYAPSPNRPWKSRFVRYHPGSGIGRLQIDHGYRVSAPTFGAAISAQEPAILANYKDLFGRLRSGDVRIKPTGFQPQAMEEDISSLHQKEIAKISSSVKKHAKGLAGRRSKKIQVSGIESRFNSEVVEFPLVVTLSKTSGVVCYSILDCLNPDIVIGKAKNVAMAT